MTKNVIQNIQISFVVESGMQQHQYFQCGEEDKLTPLKYHQFFREKMPRCQLASIKNAGHWSYVEQPEEFNRVVKEFLDSLPAL